MKKAVAGFLAVAFAFLALIIFLDRTADKAVPAKGYQQPAKVVTAVEPRKETVPEKTEPQKVEVPKGATFVIGGHVIFADEKKEGDATDK
ncbi:MAG: hypothetical protein NTY81_01340 [Candidatus Staskawiczbacteria bacterium]|nr:hypothetical protein [Candidatus Staskawiczbacteria bacterium]